MAYEFKLKRMVEFADTDAAGIMHFSHFFRFMEVTEHAFFRSLGFSIHDPDAHNKIGWPRVQAECSYKLPLRFEDVAEIHLIVREKKQKSLAYTFVIRKGNDESAQEVARGSLVVVCIKWDPANGRMAAAPIPAEIADKIEVAPKELLEQIADSK